MRGGHRDDRTHSVPLATYATVSTPARPRVDAVLDKATDKLVTTGRVKNPKPDPSTSYNLPGWVLNLAGL